MAVQGIFTSDSNIPGSRQGDFASGLLMTEQTGDAPLFALTSGMGSADATDIITTWFEENPMTGRILITNNATTGTTLTVDDVTQVVAGVVALIETTGEYVFVESIAGSNLTVTRGFGGSAITSINGSVTPVGLQRIGTAHEEASSRPTAISNLGSPRFNYMQNFRNSWDVSGTAKAINYMTGDIVAKSKADAAMLHSADIERSILFGRLAIGVMNGKAFRTMNGIVPQLQTNVTSQAAVGATTTAAEIDAFLMGVFNRNIKGAPNERIVFCGNTVVNVVNQIARLNGQYQIMPSETKFGIKVKRWETPFGEINLVTHPMFNQSPVWTKNMLVLHPAAIRVRYLRRTSEDRYDKDGTRAGVDADFGVFTTEMNVEYKAEATGGYFTGIDTAGANA